MQYRDYQKRLRDDMDRSWQRGHKRVLAVAPTGAGKTVICCGLIRERAVFAVALAHRQELVSQMSLTLARNGVPHRVIGPEGLVRECCKLQVLELGTTCYDANARTVVASVDTIIRRQYRWYAEVKLWICDEAHHLQADNKWGTAIGLFPNAIGLGVTATPHRADGCGLDCVFDDLIVGPSMLELIQKGHLTPFKIYAASQGKIDYAALKIGSTGEVTKSSLAMVTDKAQITGDIVQKYLEYGEGKRWITFVHSVAEAHRVADRFNEAGVPALALSAKTPALERAQANRKLKAGELLQLVNVDLFGEGYDLPAIEGVSFGAYTESYPRFAQWFGRPLRTAPELGKTHATIIDHVGNCLRHGLPTMRTEWSLASRVITRGVPEGVPISYCLSDKCGLAYEGRGRTCPHCGYDRGRPERSARNELEVVQGDLALLDLAQIDELHAAIAVKDSRNPADVLRRAGASGAAIGGADKRFREWQAAQSELRALMCAWSDAHDWLALRDRHVLFYRAFGTDVLTAQAANLPETKALLERVRDEISGVKEAHSA